MKPSIYQTMSTERSLSRTMRAFWQLPEAALLKVVEAFETTPPMASVEHLANHVAKKTETDADVLQDITRSIAGIISLAADDRTFTQALVQIFAAPDGDQPPTELQTTVMTRLLACEESIGLSGKAQAIMWGHGKKLEAANTITQIRPVFYSRLTRTPEHAVIVHEILLELEEAGKAEPICFTVDGAQLDMLSRMIDRAKAKEKTLRQSEQFVYLTDRGNPS